MKLKPLRVILYAIALGAVAALAIWAFRPRPIAVDIREVTRGHFEQTIDEQGRTAVRDRYTVSAPVPGLIERIALDPGDTVARGDVVAVLRPAPPSLQDTRTQAELRERVGAAEASALRARANEARAAAAAELSRHDYARAKRLAEQGFTSRSAEDSARLVLAQQEQSVKAAQFERHAADHELEMARAALSRGMGAAALGKFEIRAPVAGRVLRVLQRSEAVVTPGTALVELGDPESLEAVIDVLSQDAPRIEPGARVRMTFSQAIPAATGRVRRVEPSARTKISTLGVEEQRVAVVADFDASVSQVVIGDGYRIDAEIVVLERDAVTLAPIGALFRDAEGWAVFAAAGGRAERRPVELGARNQRVAWISKGLEAGDQVVVYPPDTLSHGTRIAPR